MIKRKIMYLGFLLIVFVLISVTYFSYAFFTGRDVQHGKLNIIAGGLTYKIESSDLNDKQLVLLANEKKTINVKITNLNSIPTKYELYYTSSSDDIVVGYTSDTVSYPRCINQDNSICTIDSNQSKVITLIVKNNTSVNQTVTFKVEGGFINNAVVISSGNSISQIPNSYEINLTNLLTQIFLDNNTTLEDANTDLLTVPNSYLVDAIYTDAPSEYQSGLFKANDTDSGITYYFRGNVNNNWIRIGNDYWRIVRINSDNSIRIIKNDGIVYNDVSVFRFNDNNSTFSDAYFTNGTDIGTNNDAYKIVEAWYNDNILNNSLYDVVSGVYCQAFKVKTIDRIKSTEDDDAELISTYIPSFSCPNDKNIVNAKYTGLFGLINIDEILMAGGKAEVNNDFYLANNNKFFTMSPKGWSNNSSVGGFIQSGFIWGVNSDNVVTSANVKGSITPTLFGIRPVINLSSNTMIVKEYDNNINAYVYVVY